MLIFLLISIFAPSPPELRYEDYIYEDQIKTVRLYPATEGLESKTMPAVTSLGGTLQLEFDDLQADLDNYVAKIIHCNYDWTPSRLSDLDFLKDYNEFNINGYAYSGNTHVPYVHYNFTLPPVKLAGNYVVIVYRDGNEDDLLLSKRFMVYSGQAVVRPSNGLGMTTVRATNHQFQFEVVYGQLDIPDPLDMVNVVIRQNQRWDNAQVDIKPSFVRSNTKTLEYRFFNDDKSFQAGNEFRFVDFKSINYPGQNTARLERSKKPFTIYVADDYSRAGQRYAQSQFADLNGGYIIDNLEDGYGEINGNYIKVVFSLKTTLSEPVYILGAFNNWQKNDESRLMVNGNSLVKELFLKQGFYNYTYETEKNATSIEGNFYETENLYEILVYYRSFNPQADQLVGYYPFRVNPR